MELLFFLFFFVFFPVFLLKPEWLEQACAELGEMLWLMINYHDWDDPALWKDYRQQNYSHNCGSSVIPRDATTDQMLQGFNRLSDERSRGEWQMQVVSNEYLQKVYTITRN